MLLPKIYPATTNMNIHPKISLSLKSQNLNKNVLF